MYVLSCGGRNGGALLFLFHLKWCPILHGTCITKDIFSGDYPRKKVLLELFENLFFIS